MQNYGIGGLMIVQRFLDIKDSLGRAIDPELGA
jgi:hypothetical protein